MINKKSKIKLKAFSLIELSIVILVIGILVAGIMEGRNLFYKSKLSSARALTKSSDVSSIKNMILWVDASSDNNLTNSNGSKNIEDGEYIASLLDQNPQMTIPVTFSSSSSLQPIYLESGLNGLPTLSFDGVDDYLSATDDRSRFSKPNNFSIFAVFAPISGHSTNSRVGIITKQTGVGISNQPYGLNFDGTNMRTGFLVVNDGNSATFGPSGAVNSLVDNIAAISTYTHDSVTTTNGFKNYLNGTLQNSGTSSSSIAFTNGNLKIGQEKDGVTTRFCKCYISEIIMYDRVLNNEERKSVTRYLSQKWSISITQ